ncbi:hypothetical protein HY993_02225 [Candidatus Micrarchaeota archaeon]|nr:hypothetical protein [Candidatus Micrarchaeota archaeon]
MDERIKGRREEALRAKNGLKKVFEKHFRGEDSELSFGELSRIVTVLRCVPGYFEAMRLKKDREVKNVAIRLLKSHEKLVSHVHESILSGIAQTDEEKLLLQSTLTGLTLKKESLVDEYNYGEKENQGKKNTLLSDAMDFGVRNGRLYDCFHAANSRLLDLITSGQFSKEEPHFASHSYGALSVLAEQARTAMKTLKRGLNNWVF